MHDVRPPRGGPTPRVVAWLAAGLASGLLACGGAAPPKGAAYAAPARTRTDGVQEAQTALSDQAEAKDAVPAPEAPPAAGAPGFAFPAPPPRGAPSPGPSSGPGAGPATARTPGALDTTESAKAQRLVYTAHLTLAVHAVDPSLDAVARLAAESGGYLALREDTTLTVRIPRARFQAILEAIGALGDVLHRDVRAEDVSDEWVDLEARITNARALRDRLRALLEKAAVKEAIEIEKELARVTEELERFEGKMKLLSDRVAYSTVTVTFAPRGGGGAPPTVRLPFGWVSGLGLGPLMNLQETKR